MKEYSFQIKIYAIRASDGKVLYVGASCDLAKRIYRHKAFHGSGLDGCSFDILRTADELNAPRIESQIIKAYKRRGQCQLNKRISPAPINRDGCSIEHNGTLFPSLAALARTFNCSVQTLRARGIISA